MTRSVIRNGRFFKRKSGQEAVLCCCVKLEVCVFVSSRAKFLVGKLHGGRLEYDSYARPDQAR
jgi:hypothetical protein